MDKSTTANHLIAVYTEIFGQTAVVWTDSGPHLTSGAFQDSGGSFTKSKKSSSYYSQSNGKAEVTVKAMKIILKAVCMDRTIFEQVGAMPSLHTVFIIATHR